MRVAGGAHRRSRLAPMPGRALITLCAAAWAVAIAGCGSDGGTIPSGDSEDMLSLLGGIEENVAAGNCDIAQGQVEQLAGVVDGLPQDVDAEVREGLDQATANLSELASNPEQCEDASGTTDLGGVEPEPETTTPEPETTTTTTTSSSTTTEPEEEPAPEEETDEGDEGTGGGPTETPPGQDGEAPGNSGEGPASGGIGGEKRGDG